MLESLKISDPDDAIQMVDENDAAAPILSQVLEDNESDIAQHLQEHLTNAEPMWESSTYIF